jgi:GntR family transcriptional regulator
LTRFTETDSVERVETPASEGARPIAYRALAKELREAIQRGDFGRGGQLPTEAQLSKEHGVSRQTVRRALQDLVADGLVYRVQGRGTFVSGLPTGRQYVQSVGSIEDVAAMAENVVLEVVDGIRPEINVDAAGRMGLPSDEVFTGSVRRLYGGVPFAISWFWLPPAVGRVVLEDGLVSDPGAHRRESVLRAVERLCRRTIAGAQQSITARAASDEVAAHLDIGPGTPTLRVDRLYHDTSGDAVELATSYFNPSRYSYRVTLRRSLDKHGAFLR